ncbi:MAG: hypothetical protein ACTSRG_00510 [Candidatus Helarchaeota archaeon]
MEKLSQSDKWIGLINVIIYIILSFGALQLNLSGLKIIQVILLLVSILPLFLTFLYGERYYGARRRNQLRNSGYTENTIQLFEKNIKNFYFFITVFIILVYTAFLYTNISNLTEQTNLININLNFKFSVFITLTILSLILLICGIIYSSIKKKNITKEFFRVQRLH